MTRNGWIVLVFWQLLEMAGNDWKLQGMAGDGGKWPELAEMPGNV